jgi:hypothetical protein
MQLGYKFNANIDRNVLEIKKEALDVTAAISSHSFVGKGVTIAHDVLQGHAVVLINDPRPPATLHGLTQAEIDLTARSRE